MGRLRYRLLLVVLLVALAGAPSLYAQTQWDSALDKYEQICNQCIDLRQRILDGESVPAKSLTTLLQDMSALRTTLQNGSGSMTASQKRRFERIRDKYQSVVSPSATSKTAATDSRKSDSSKSQNTVRQTTSAKVVAPQVVAIPEEQSAAESIPIPRIDTMLFRIDSSLSAVAALIEQSPQGLLPQRQAASVELPAVPSKDSDAGRVGIVAQAGYSSTALFGVSGLYTKNNLGAYLSVLSNGVLRCGEYTTDSQGNILSGGSFWSDGTSSRSAYSVTAGILGKAYSNLYLGLGTGYSSNTLLWRDRGGNWADVDDLSYKGVVVEAQALYFHKMIILSASIQLEPSSMTFSPVVGLGYRF